MSSRSIDEAEKLHDERVARIKESLEGLEGGQVSSSPANKPDPIHINQITTVEQIKAIANVLVNISSEGKD